MKESLISVLISCMPTKTGTDTFWKKNGVQYVRVHLRLVYSYIVVSNLYYTCSKVTFVLYFVSADDANESN